MDAQAFGRLMKPLVTGPIRSWTDEECIEAIRLIDGDALNPVQQSALVIALHILGKGQLPMSRLHNACCYPVGEGLCARPAEHSGDCDPRVAHEDGRTWTLRLVPPEADPRPKPAPKPPVSVPRPVPNRSGES